MNKQNQPTTLKGFRDLLPAQATIRKRVKETLVDVFESFGYEPLETPTLEQQSLLLGKYGDEADKLVYKFEDNGKRKVGLRYDLTVPLARVVSQYRNELPLPFKRYQIQNVFRADKPSKGRYREFTQCDIDIVGNTSPLADAEIVALIEKSLKKLDFTEFTIRVNSRQVLFNVMETAGVPKNKVLSVIQSIDKLDKKTQEEVEAELADKGIASITIKDIFSSLKNVQPDEYLQKVISAFDSLNVQKTSWKFDPTLARGLDYYTGPIFETVVTKPKIGSITGGGRYDKLLDSLGSTDLPAVGTTIGLDRVMDVILDQNLWPESAKSTAQVFVSIFDPSFEQYSLKIASELREQGINVETYLNSQEKLTNQLKYADRKNIPYAIIAGSNEVNEQKITVKNLQTGEQKIISTDEAITLFQGRTI
jgi:histidyl-tRNA synthetase